MVIFHIAMLNYQRVPLYWHQRSATQLPPPEFSQLARPNVGSAPRDFPASAARNGWMKQPDGQELDNQMWKIGHTNLTECDQEFWISPYFTNKLGSHVITNHNGTVKKIFSWSNGIFCHQQDESIRNPSKKKWWSFAIFPGIPPKTSEIRQNMFIFQYLFHIFPEKMPQTSQKSLAKMSIFPPFFHEKMPSSSCTCARCARSSSSGVGVRTSRSSASITWRSWWWSKGEKPLEIYGKS